MQINKEFLKSINPCADRYKHFLEHHSDFDGNFIEFLDLGTISYEDKVLIAEKVLTKNQAVSWAILCAESVMYIFEANYPGNKRLSKCINFLKSIKDFNNLTDTEKWEIKKHEDISGVNYVASAVHYALYTAYYALYAVNYAANYAFHYAARSASYAVYAALLAAADTGEDADAAGNNQQELNIQFLRMACSL